MLFRSHSRNPILTIKKKDSPASIPGNHICSIRSGFDPATVTPDKANKPVTNKKPINIQQATVVSYQGMYFFLKNGGRSARMSSGHCFISGLSIPYVVSFLLTYNNILVNLLYVDHTYPVWIPCVNTKQQYVNFNLISSQEVGHV